MASLNKVSLIGYLAKDVELVNRSSTPIAHMTIVTNESYTGRDGQRVERAEFHRVVAFQRQAENCANYLRKGSMVFVEGSLQTRKWQDQNGQDRYVTEIKAFTVQFLDRKSDGQGQGGGQQQQQGGYSQSNGQQAPYNNGGAPSEYNDEVPF